MSKEIYISSTPHETRLAIVENDSLTEIYYERENEYTLAGSIYKGRVTRVLPGMQSSFVDIGLERDAFLYITDFMEEAGDTADFEGSSDRGPKRERGERPDRGDRPAQEPRTVEGTFETAAPAGEPREPRREGEGGGRRRGGRNRRGRGPREGQGQQAPREGQVEQQATPEPFTIESDDYAFDPDFQPLPDVETSEASGESLGEGAPGADGSRRWRGRRGRRRGGRNGRPDGVTAPQAGGEASRGGAFASPEAAVFTGGFDEEPISNDGDSMDFDAEAATEPINESSSADQLADFSRPLSDNVEEPAWEPRRERNRAGGRDRGGRGERPRRDAAYGAETGPVEDAYGSSEPAGEPIILPGESLAKYNPETAKAFEANVTAANNAAAAPPVVEDFKLPGQWDGGAVLPGETLRPRTGAASAYVPSTREDRGGRGGRDDRGGRGDRGGRDRGGRGGRGERPAGPREPRAEHRFDGDRSELRVREPRVAEPVEVASPAEEPLLTVGIVETPAYVAPIHAYEPATHVIPAVEAVEPVAAEPEVIEAAPHAEAADFAEVHASELAASHAVPPVQASFVQDAPIAPSSYTPTPTEFSPAETSADPFASSSAPTPLAEVEHELAGLPAHEITTLDATGDLHSEPVDAPAPTAPIEHEHAVVAEAVVGGETIPAALTPPAEEQTWEVEGGEDESPNGVFAPGDGALYEEELEDEDEPVALQARHEETEFVEGGSDLGSILADLSVDQLTLSDQDEDEDDYEEEFDEDELSEAEEQELTRDEFTRTDEPEGDEESDVEGESFGYAATPVEGQPETARREPGEGRRGRRGRNRDDRGGREPREAAPREAVAREPREPREGGRDRDRDIERPRNTGAGANNDRHRGHGRGRSMQTTNLPAISDLLKPGQEVLVQIAKEPIAKKGARITSHIALPGRFLVFMPTVSHTGVSRKIESDGERRRLKEILLSEKGEASGGFIVRTAAAGASEEELRSDLRFLLNLWTDIKSRAETSKPPALIYHDLNLVERILRDQVTDNFSAIWVDTEQEYERVLRFLQRFQPSLLRRVKLYTKETPLFDQFGITEEINKGLRSKVWLKSGGSIVINQTEALVAIDINTGKYVGKTARLEDTIVKTNLDAIPEIVRQIRLRDLGGIIIIDFIDMDERKNRAKVMAALEDELKSDRAPSKLLSFNDFGLVAITRKRVKQSLERTLSTPCNTCAGTGMVKSPITVCNEIYIEMRKMHKHLDRGDVMLRVNPEVVKQLKAPGTKWLQEMEEMVGKTILIRSDPALHPEQFDIH